MKRKMHYIPSIALCLFVLLTVIKHLQASEKLDITVKNNLVYAQIEKAPTFALLQQLAKHAKVELTLIGELKPFSSLNIEGKSLIKAISLVVPEVMAIVAEYNENNQLQHLSLYAYSSEQTLTKSRGGITQRQQYINRQVGMSDADTLNMMREVLLGQEAGTIDEKLAALQVLKNIEGKEVSHVIEQSSHDDDMSVRLSALDTLYEQAGEYQSIQIIVQKYFQGSKKERKMIAKILVDATHPAAMYIHYDIKK